MHAGQRSDSSVIPQKSSAFSFEPASYWTWSSLILLECHLCLLPKHWNNDPSYTQLLCGSLRFRGSVLLTEPPAQPELCFLTGRKWSSVRELRIELFFQGYIKKVGAQGRWDTVCTPYFTDTAVTPQWRQQESCISRQVLAYLVWTVSSWALNPHSQVQVCMWERPQCLSLWICLPNSSIIYWPRTAGPPACASHEMELWVCAAAPVNLCSYSI